MPSIYTQAESNTRKTWLLMTGFLVLVIAIGWVFSYLYNNVWILIVAIFYSILTSFGSYWYSDKIILNVSKAHQIEKKDNQELYNIVENLCITAGLPFPKIYILEEEQPNAFTTGRDARHAIVVVTRGLLEKLERNEIEGVIAHELSHIKNKDILLGTVIVILVGTIAMSSNLFLRISFWGGMRERDSRDSGGLEIVMLILGIFAVILAPIAASLIHLAISRKREFLADASGALLTRYPEGLASALEKISQDTTPLKVANNSTAHLYIANPFKREQRKNWFAKLFMTHPPIEERIKILRGMNI